MRMRTANQTALTSDKVTSYFDTAPPLFSTPEEMLNANLGLDGVIISSHTKDHARDALTFCSAGIPVRTMYLFCTLTVRACASRNTRGPTHGCRSRPIQPPPMYVWPWPPVHVF